MKPSQRFVVCVQNDVSTLKIATPLLKTVHNSKKFLLCGGVARLGWSQFATGGVEVCVLRGKHNTLLREPFVDRLAAQLGSRMNGSY